MNRRAALSWLFAHLLRLYPRGWRREFEDEVLEVHRASMQEAAMKNVTMSTGLREIGGALAGAIREQLRQVRMREPLPGHLVLRSTLGFMIGWTLLIVMRGVLPAAYATANPHPPLVDIGLLQEMAGVALLGASVGLALGFGRWSRIVALALGVGIAGGFATVALRIVFYAVPDWRSLLARIGAQVGAEFLLGAAIGALVGAVRGGGKAAAVLAPLAGVISAAAFPAMELALDAASGLVMAAGNAVGTFALLLMVVPFGAVDGAFFGLALRWQEKRAAPAARAAASR